MDLTQIKSNLQSPDFQNRLRAITALRQYDPEVAVPLLLNYRDDQEVLVRSFVAMGLGRKQTAGAFTALLEIMQNDGDPHVRAEAANSLSLYGDVAVSHLALAFSQDHHCLVRRSILAGLFELNCPEVLFEVCLWGLQGEESTVKEASIEGLGLLAGTNKREMSLLELLNLIKSPEWRIRVQVAKALGKFNDPKATEGLSALKGDNDYRVVSSALESLF
jgi:HEAT repeat protein